MACFVQPSISEIFKLYPIRDGQNMKKYLYFHLKFIIWQNVSIKAAYTHHPTCQFICCYLEHSCMRIKWIFSMAARYFQLLREIVQLIFHDPKVSISCSFIHVFYPISCHINMRYLSVKIFNFIEHMKIVHDMNVPA